MQQLLNPFAQKYPEAVDCTLSTQASSIGFNPSGPFAGHYLAAGGSDGLVEVWDVESRGVVRVFEGHAKAVGSVSWSRNNRYLLTASLDSTAIIWDLSILTHPLLSPSTPATGSHTSNNLGSTPTLNPNTPSTSTPASTSTSRLHTIRFDAPVMNAEFHPRNSRIFLATLSCNEVLLVDLRPGSGGKYRLEEEVEMDEMDVDGDARKKSSLSCALWSACGTRIYAATTQGTLLVFDPVTRQVLHKIRICNSKIQQMAFDASGHNLIISSSDRALRVCVVSPTTGLLEPVHKFQDSVNRTPWYAVGFSGDGEYVMGGAGHKMAHNVFIWDRESGVLVKVLEGPKEPLTNSDWHPTRPVIASVAQSGDIHIWQTSSPDNWAAFAPGFEELEENVEYDEREDEFDIEDETDLARRKDAEEDTYIDVLKPQEDAYPRRPRPIPAASVAAAAASTTTASPAGDGQGAAGGESESDEVRAARMMLDAVKWAEARPDDDDWEGFYLSIDLLEQRVDEEEEL